MLVYAVIDDSLSPRGPLGDWLGVVVRHEDAKQSAYLEPVYVLFEDFTHVKFYRRSL